MVSTFGGHFVVGFETRSDKGSVFLLFAWFESFTHLDLFLAQSDAPDNLCALALVRFGVFLICSFKDGVIFRAIRDAWSAGFQMSVSCGTEYGM